MEEILNDCIAGLARGDAGALAGLIAEAERAQPPLTRAEQSRCAMRATLLDAVLRETGRNLKLLVGRGRGAYGPAVGLASDYRSCL